MDPIILAVKRNFTENRKKRKSKNNELIGTSPGILSIYVTPKMIPRALNFMDALIKTLKQLGYKISFKDHYGSLVVVNGIEFPIRLREKCRRIKKDDKPWSTSELEPIGKIVFTVDAFPRKEWEDSDYKLLDLKIPSIVKYLQQKAEQEIEYNLEWEKRKKEQEIQRRLDEEQRKHQEKEKQKFNELLEASERWHQAQKILEYINAVKSHAKDISSITAERRSWLDWANRKADELYSLKIF